MQDRVPTKPNRYAVYDDAHNFIRHEYHERADEPAQVGSALNKANLLPDDVATALGLNPAANPKVKDGLQNCYGRVGDIKVTLRKDLGDDWLLCNGENLDRNKYRDLVSYCKIDQRYWEIQNIYSGLGIQNDSFGHLNHVVFNNGTIAVIGRNTSNRDRVQVMYSDNIEKPMDQWNTVTIKDSGGVGSVHYLFYINNVWIAIVDEVYVQEMFVSDDLLTWTNRGTIYLTSNCAYVAYYDNTWITVMQSNNQITKIYKNNGKYPTFSTSLLLDVQQISVISWFIDYINGAWRMCYVADGRARYASYASLPGTISFNDFKAMTDVSDIRGISKVTYIGNVYTAYLCVRSGFIILTSNDFVTWKSRPVLSDSTNIMQFAGIAGEYIFVQEGSRVFFSSQDNFNLIQIRDDRYPDMKTLSLSPRRAIFYNNKYYIVWASTSAVGISSTDMVLGPILPVITADNAYCYIRGKQQ